MEENFLRFQRSWEKCKRCNLCETRKQVVFGRGRIPASILFIGEAPGKVEDLQGLPFVGRSGKLLEKAIQAAAEENGLKQFTDYYITNVVACRPTDSRYGDNRQPTRDEIAACKERVIRVIHLLNPKKIVLVGKIAQNHCKSLAPNAVGVYHPAYILRRGGESSTEFQNLIRELSSVIAMDDKKGKLFS